MGLFTKIAILFLFFILSESWGLSFIVFLVLTVVFLTVITFSPLARGGLTDFLLLSLYIIIFIFLTTTSLLVFFAMYELSLFPVSLLILLIGYQPEKIKSLLYLILYTVVCSCPFLYFAISSSLSIWCSFSTISMFATSLVCLSFMVKSPLYTLHSWLPQAHVEADVVGSMLLAGVILKLGRYGFLILSPYLKSFILLYAFLRLTGGVVCSIICFRSWDMKSLVAYSSVVHIGRVSLGGLSGLELGRWVSCGMLVGHSLLSPSIFFLANEVYRCSGSRSFIHGYTSSVALGLIFVLRFCSGLNFGLPPFLNFWVEVSLFSLQGSLWSLSLIPLILTAFLSFLYSILFYVLARGGSSSSAVGLSSSFYGFLLPLSFSFLLSFCSSVLLF